MTRRNQMIVLGVLVAMLVGTLLYTFRPSGDSVKAPTAAGLFPQPLNIDNPALRLDILQRFLNLEYKGAHRNIFVASLPPPPPPPPMPPVVVAPPVNTAPPPLTIATKYFDFLPAPNGMHRRAFFPTTNTENGFIAGEADP